MKFVKTLVAALLCAAAIHAQYALKRAPGFCLSDTTGQWRDLYDYRGKVVLVEFMQTTCSHCAAFAPKLISLTQKYGGKVQVLSISVQENPQNLTQYVKAIN